MPEHLRRRATRYPPAIPMRPAGYGGAGPSPSLALLDDAPGIAVVAPPKILPHGARNATHWSCPATCRVVGRCSGSRIEH
jgi:hypothetical protein